MREQFFYSQALGTSAKTVIVSGEYPFLAESLRKQGTEVIETAPDERLPQPVRFHPDMQICVLDEENMFVLRGGTLKSKLETAGFDVIETWAEPLDAYPGDVLCNAFVQNGCLVGNMNTLDGSIRAAAKNALREIHVKQGYAACSTAIIDEKSAITSDRGIASALNKAGVDVLVIKPGFIELPGYDTGFIGGCCGLISPKVLAISGKLDRHPSGEDICRFLKDRKIDVLEMRDGDLLDVGGILTIR